MAKLVTTGTFEEEVIKSSLPVVIDLFAPWCPPCKLLSPIFDELSKELADKYKLVSVNVEEEGAIAAALGVVSIPTLIFVKNGEVVGREVGYLPKEELKKRIEEIFAEKK